MYAVLIISIITLLFSIGLIGDAIVQAVLENKENDD